jgi:hypothetical protein
VNTLLFFVRSTRSLRPLSFSTAAWMCLMASASSPLESRMTTHMYRSKYDQLL